MTKKSKTVVFFGNERLATGVTTQATTLKGLIHAGYRVAAVVVNQDDYRSRATRELEVEAIAISNHIPVLKPQKLNDIKADLESFGADIGVLAAYGKIIPGAIIDIFPRGIVNIHPSLLPKGRGPTPIEQVILQGEKETGVSIMQLVQEMDAGPVFKQTELKLRGDESKQELADSLLKLGGEMVLELLPAILEGSITPKPQDNDKASFNDLISKEDGQIDWSKPAQTIEREIRAYIGWPKSRTNLAGLEAIITVAKVVNDMSLSEGQTKVDGSKLYVGCSNGSLEIIEIQPANKSAMPIEAFLAGYRQLFN